MLERRQDSCRELRRATALHQADEGVQIDPALMRQLFGQICLEPGLAQARPSPCDDLVRPAAGPCLLSGSNVHFFLAPGRGPFLLPVAVPRAGARATDAPGRDLGSLLDGSASVKAAAEISLATAGGVCLGRGCQLACVLIGGVEVHTRRPNGVVQFAPVISAQRARCAVREERGHGGPADRDLFVVLHTTR